MQKFSFEISENFDSVVSFLRRQGFSNRNIVFLRKQVGRILINNNIAFSNSLLRTHDVLTVFFNEEKEREVDTFHADCKIVFEDDSFLVVDKIAGLAIMNTKLHFGKSLQNVLACKLGKTFCFHAVNRLDKDTSGLLIVAKSAPIQHMFSKVNVEKTYLALVEGQLHGCQVIDVPIFHDTEKKRCVVDDRGKVAKTQYEVLENFNNATLVKVKIFTGRTHQIRVHFAYLGHPLIGDLVYGTASQAIARHALHASQLKFLHPLDKKMIQLESDLPTDFKSAIISMR